ncbi:MAG: sigma-54-dependent Fis family transcriptional regulator [Gammaproteobacteria bacterium]|nr:sigma-54-dependent Fis family transcriptional regulator [Gammaproteobacteria bacterium]
MSSQSVLIVEDSASLSLLYKHYLSNEPVRVNTVETGAAALESIKKEIPQAIVLDLQLPDMSGMDILDYVRSEKFHTSVVMVTGHGSVNLAVDAMRAGAFDFIEKPFAADRLIITLRNALEQQRLRDLVATYKDSARDSYYGFIGASDPMQAIYSIIGHVASSRATVFITGESGTGKEVCAEAIHRRGDRNDKPFVTINCAAIPKDLMESEIFGHVKGAFTGAYAAREGAAARADGGTLFLDEIGDMSLDLQTKLLRFIQTGTFQKVGDSKLEKVDIRFICATNRDPLREVEEGRFREDLYYRLHVIPIHLPPLRERGNDVLLIARKFLYEYTKEENKSFKSFSTETEAVFLDYEWPGNVRHLQNTIRQLVVLNEGEIVSPEMLPGLLPGSANVVGTPAQSAQMPVSVHKVPGASPLQKNAGPESIRPLRKVEKEIIENAIALCEGNIPKAAIFLEISASTIYRKLQAWEGKH